VSQPGKIAYRGNGNIYLNITNRCSSDCRFCLRTFTQEVYGEPLVLAGEPSVEEIEQAVELEYLEGPADEVAFCGFGEPTLRLDVVTAVSEWLRLRHIPSRLVTNGHGQLVNPYTEVVPALSLASLAAATVSLNAADPEAYELLCRPMFSKAHRAVIRFAEDCVRHGIATTLTAVDVPEADLEACASLAADIGAGFRVRSLVRPSERRGGAEREGT
jgi:TatD family-associated radical SAM protein